MNRIKTCARRVNAALSKPVSIYDAMRRKMLAKQAQKRKLDAIREMYSATLPNYVEMCEMDFFNGRKVRTPEEFIAMWNADPVVLDMPIADLADLESFAAGSMESVGAM